MISLYVFA